MSAVDRTCSGAGACCTHRLQPAACRFQRFRPSSSVPLQHGRRSKGWCQRVQADDSVRVGTPDTTLSDLQAQLDAAVALEDYGLASGLRDELHRRQADDREAVQFANAQFYAAFRNADIKGMQEAWGEGAHLQCIHPVSNCLAGRHDVMEGWRLLLGTHGRFGRLDIEDVRIHVFDSSAFVTCTEIVEHGDSSGRVVATNVFERQNGQWKMVHHHGSPVPRFRRP